VGAFARAHGPRVGNEVHRHPQARGGRREHAHDEQWTVVGVLAPTGTPTDRAIFITLRSFFT
jgi:putative ABC transport system permease protein